MEWHPIETAPKTGGWDEYCGPEILLFFPEWNENRGTITIGFWRQMKTQKSKKTGWRYAGGERIGWHGNSFWEPSHWMPLPELPKVVP